MNYDRFIDTVAQRVRLPYDQAEIVTYGMLQTLAEGLTASEAHDLASQLPKPLHEPLAKQEGFAEPLDVDEFLNRVWQRSGLDAERVTDAVRAVFCTVREAVTPGEFEDVMAQFPKEFGELATIAVR